MPDSSPTHPTLRLAPAILLPAASPAFQPTMAVARVDGRRPRKVPVFGHGRMMIAFVGSGGQAERGGGGGGGGVGDRVRDSAVDGRPVRPQRSRPAVVAAPAAATAEAAPGCVPSPRLPGLRDGADPSVLPHFAKVAGDGRVLLGAPPAPQRPVLRADPNRRRSRPCGIYGGGRGGRKGSWSFIERGRRRCGRQACGARRR